jgi:hypothetical protein
MFLENWIILMERHKLLLSNSVRKSRNISLIKIDKVNDINEEMLFYLQTLADQYKISHKTEQLELMQDIAAEGVVKEVNDVIRKIIGKIMLDFDQLGLKEEGKDYIVFESLKNNENLIKLVESEMKYASSSMDINECIVKIVNELDKMTFLRRVICILHKIIRLVQVMKSGMKSQISQIN